MAITGQERWDKAFSSDHAKPEQIRAIYTLASELYWHLYGNRCFGNTGSEYGWLSWLYRVYGNPRPRCVLEIGSGNGDLLLDLRRMNLADQYVGMDVSAVAVQVSQQKATEAGFSNLRFEVGDLNKLELAPQCYDMILAQMCIHHIENLEHLFAQVARALTPNGLFAINDYVGPSRWQFTRTQILLANALLYCLPDRLKVSHPEGNIKGQLKRPTIHEMLAMDASEAVRSEEILRVFKQYFSVERQIDYGGSVSILVLDTIISNFKVEDRTSVRWLKSVFWIDHWARRLRLVPRVNLVIAGRPHKNVGNTSSLARSAVTNSN
jgi:ubiquinone/menaquinone biosynthesis C-methylase UbiE